jgi:hypothetical protein
VTVAERDLEFAAVTRWRYQRLVKLGVPLADAIRIAHEHDVDLHEIERLIRQGCAPEVAVRIVE